MGEYSWETEIRVESRLQLRHSMPWETEIQFEREGAVYDFEYRTGKGLHVQREPNVGRESLVFKEEEGHRRCQRDLTAWRKLRWLWRTDAKGIIASRSRIRDITV